MLGAKDKVELLLHDRELAGDAVAMSKLRSHLASLVDQTTGEDTKLKAAQEVSENLETIVSSQHYPNFLETAIPIFVQLLREGEPQFITDSCGQQLRKLVLELIHRLPTNDHLKAHVKSILSAMFFLLEIENEENVLVCLRIIIEHHKQFRPSLSPEISRFLQFVKTIYADLPKTMTTLLEPEGEGAGAEDAANKTTGVLPKAATSLKVLAELPIIVVLMYQLYKATVHNTVIEFIPLTMNAITLQPSAAARQAVSFNKEIYVDFIAVQIKFLSFLAYIIRIYQEQVNSYAGNMVQGMLNLLKNCPQEVAHLRRELLIAARHILATDMRNRFVSVIDQLLDEDVLIGGGWTTRDTVRPLAYSILADLVHHIRTFLTLPNLSVAVHVFSSNVHDDTLPVSIQTMSCKLLLNLVESIRIKAEQEPTARDILMRMMKVFIIKFKSIAAYEIPDIFKRCQNSSSEAVEDGSHSSDGAGGLGGGVSDSSLKSGEKRLGLPSSGSSSSISSASSSQPASAPLSVSDCRGIVKTLVCGMKTITWGAGSCKIPGSNIDYSSQNPKTFLPHETKYFIDLFRYGLIALDIYRVTVHPSGVYILRSSNCQTVKTREEKEVLEHFAGVFTMMAVGMYKEIFKEMIEYLVDHIESNYALQIIPNSFLANPTTSPAFASILLQFLLSRMEKMGENMERSNLYLKLFKLVFGSVTIFAQDNELMLKHDCGSELMRFITTDNCPSLMQPHLHQIVLQSMSLANTTPEPCNYFLLLRALFRSIGGGSHEQLYQEFLPLLSNLLQGLNRLQSGRHKQYMKDLFVELCLTVPVRLSSLLPYLHMLMDPLVSALSGSQTLISQGLRTLELCVDNLQPDFLYDHIQPVRAELMQALWKTLYNPDNSVAGVAYRVLGKFGGSNRKMLSTPQPLEYRDGTGDGAVLLLQFQGAEQSVELPVGRSAEVALRILKTGNSSVELFYKQHAWLTIQALLVSMLNLGDTEVDLHQLLKQTDYHPTEFNTGRLKHISLPQCPNKDARAAFENALTGVFVALTIPELRSEAQPFATGIVKHMTTVAVVQQCCSANLLKQPAPGVMDVHVLLDSIAKCMSSEETELNKVGGLALGIVMETAATILGDRERACGLPLFEVAVDKLCACCYERAWFAKNGGCMAISFLVEKMPLKWVLSHQLCFLMALMFVLLNLSGEVSSGTITRAKNLIDKLLIRCNTPLTEEMKPTLTAVQERSFYQVTRHLVKEVISPNENVRTQSHRSLEKLSELTQQSVTVIMEPHRELLADMIPPKKHLLKHQPVSTQIALMDGNTFCTSLSPRLFSIDLSITEHKVFFNELLALCESEDVQLSKLPCYRAVPSLIPLKVSGLSALAACHYLVDQRERVFQVLYKAINSSVKGLQEAGKTAMKKFMTDHTQSDIELVHSALRPLLMMLGDYRNLNPALLQRLTHMVSLFPTSFNEKMCDSLLAHLRRWTDVLVTNAAQTGRRGDEVAVCLHIMEMMYMLPAATFRLLEPLLVLMVKAEKALGVELGSPFRDPVLKFALKFPLQTVEFFLSHLTDTSLSSLFHCFLEHSDGSPLRDQLATAPEKIIAYTFAVKLPNTDQAMIKLHELNYQGLYICNLLIEGRPDWITDKPEIVEHLRKLWSSDSFHVRVSSDSAPFDHWRQSSMCLNSLLQHCKHHPEDVETLFLLLRAFLERHISTNHLLYSYLESTVATTYTIAQRRNIFFKFVEVFGRHDYSQEHKAKILQYVVIPIFSATFEEGTKTDELLGGPPDPEHDSEENIISVFINKVINPEKPFASSDSVCILLLQFSSLLVENAYAHIHDSNNKKQGAKLRRLMTFAWPCLLPKQCVDPATKYHGHLLLAHIIARFAIHKRIVLQVFHSLLKAHALEARSIVRQALDILTPVVPVRMEDANATLVHWTKKIIVEEGHTVAQLTHMLQLLCRHYKVYFPVRQHLVQHMVSSIQRLGLTANATAEQKKLAVDLAEVIIKWEFQRLKEQQDHEGEPMDHEPAVKEHAPLLPSSSSSSLSLKRSASDGSADSKRGGRPQQTISDPHWALDRQHSDAVINFLIRIACQVSDSQPQPPPSAGPASSGEILSKRCVSLVKTTLKPDIWPHIDIKLPWFIKLFEGLSTVDPASSAATSLYYNVCTALDILTFLLSVLPRPTLLAGFKTLNKGFNICMTCDNTKVVRYLILLLSRLMAMFPTEPASAAVASKLEELEPLYASVVRIVNEGLTNFEKPTAMNTVSLHCVLMILKAACNNDPCYIDRFQTIFLKVLHQLHKDHISTTAGTSSDAQAVSELLQLCLELMKGRVTTLSQEARKGFFTILTSLIEKSTDVKVLKTLTRIIDEWVRSRNEVPLYSLPSLREISLLVSRMMVYYEKRFPDDVELLTQFLEIVLYIYKSETLSQTELTVKLEPSFLCGLRSPDVQLRARFFEVYNHSIQQRLFDRLLYIMCSQNWEHCGSYFWIKHCLELILAVAALDQPILPAPPTPQLPSVASVGPAQTTLTHDVPEPPAISSQLPEELMEGGMDTDRGDSGGMGALSKLSSKLSQFLSELKSVKSGQYLLSLAQLCYADTMLAYEVWVTLFPRLWACLSDHQRQALSGEVSPFMCSGAHVTQMDSHPSAIGAFLEGVLQCQPQPPVRSCVLKYLAKTHNFWHGCVLLMEDRCESQLQQDVTLKEPPPYDGNYSDQLLDPFKQETLDSLSDLYTELNEKDLWAGLWTLRCQFPQTVTAIAFESQGHFEQAQVAYESAIKEARDLHNMAAAPPSVLSEYQLWEDHWCRCAQELGQWDTLNDFGKSQDGANPFLVLENAWRVQDWVAMKETSTQAEPICSEAYSSKLNLLRGFLALCYPDEQRLNAVEKLIEAASIQSIKQWRRLPSVVAHVHIPLLQLSQQIMELQEAHTVHNGLQMGGLQRQNFHTDVKTIFKTWKNRLPNCSDDLSHWSDIFCWRQLHYKHLVKAYENSSNAEQSNHAMVIVHHSATAIIQYAKIARKQHLHTVCLDSLSKIHSMPSVPVLDCFQKIRQQVKCYIQMSGAMESSELQDALEVIESTNLKYFTKEMIAEFMALKGSFLAHIGRSEDANKSFSAAVQLHDSLVKAWALWGDYLDQLFASERNLTLGASALTCYLHACRNQSEAKSRKYLARIIWMLTYDDEKNTLAETVDKYYIGIAPVLWLPWIPQLLTCLVRREGNHILNLLCSVGKAYPQAIYFPIRTLYLTLKMEQREKHKADQQSKASTPTTTTAERPLPSTPQPVGGGGGGGEGQGEGEAMDTTLTAGSQGVKGQSDSSLAKQLNQVQLLQAKISAITSQLQQHKTGPAPSTTPTTPSQELPGGAPPTTPSSQGPVGESVPIRAPASLWRCSRIMHLLRDLHPTLLSALEGIVDQMVWFRENWYEELLRQLNEGLVMCQSAAFASRADVANAQIPADMFQFVRRLVTTFGISLEQTGGGIGGTGGGGGGGALSHETLAKRAQAAAQDPAFQRLKAQFAADFDFSTPGAKRLHTLMAKLKRWIKILELKTKSLQKSFLLEDRCRFLSNFSLATADMDIPGEYLMPKAMPYYVRIARFMPRVEIVQRHHSTVRRLYIQGDNGKVYPYLVVNDTQVVRCRSEERVLQLLSMVNLCLEKNKETGHRYLQFTVPRVVAVAPQMRLVEDNTSNISLTDIFKQYCSSVNHDWDMTTVQYYERLAQLQAHGETITPETLQTLFSQIQTSYAPRSLFREWAEKTYTNPTDFWTFRMQFTKHLALCGMAEFVFHLTRLEPDLLYIVRSTGCLTQAFLTFDINGKGELDANRSVPFRLTPSIQHLISPIGIAGPLHMSMVAIARCLVQVPHSLPSILQAVLRDQFISWQKREEEIRSNSLVSTADIDNETIISLVTGAVTAILARLHNLAEFEDGSSKVSTLISEAASIRNISRMDPAWNPWL